MKIYDSKDEIIKALQQLCNELIIERVKNRDLPRGVAITKMRLDDEIEEIMSAPVIIHRWNNSNESEKRVG